MSPEPLEHLEAVVACCVFTYPTVPLTGGVLGASPLNDLVLFADDGSSKDVLVPAPTQASRQVEMAQPPEHGDVALASRLDRQQKRDPIQGRTVLQPLEHVQVTPTSRFLRKLESQMRTISVWCNSLPMCAVPSGLRVAGGGYVTQHIESTFPGKNLSIVKREPHETVGPPYKEPVGDLRPAGQTSVPRNAPYALRRRESAHCAPQSKDRGK